MSTLPVTTHNDKYPFAPPDVQFQMLAGVKGSYFINTNITGHPVFTWRGSNDSDIESPTAALWVKNTSIYPIQIFEPQVHVNAPATPWATIASTTDVLRSKSTTVKQANVVTVSGGAADSIILKTEFSWNLTDGALSHVLTKGLLDCDLSSQFLPPRLVAQARDPKLDSALNVRISVLMVMGPFVQASPMIPQEVQWPAKYLFCPPTFKTPI
ncbi:hypothetical protein AMAG_04489 [Allomyces macrogynus ATCC 38327]|uniref:Uncharacterized protein n=1 Tax=Allomyces macrogynus (strain ATCC 38327) TaxID=578462 RepID=A0A0L0S5I4_ALLM3|nr:hypothetical protein AMAG_04489 [Allomyces macrogynus ATCC 38327]|eukprot:KNE57624.1 hypothetical protein AMAG_04489 [Allomyces macrogynus ATCC 38327]